MSPASQRLVGIAEIARLFDVSRQRAQQIVLHSDFPKPIAVIAAGRIWRESDVLRWAERRGRPVHLDED